MNFTWLLIFAILTFLISTMYFYMFSRKQEKFMQYWGFSWVAYSCSLLCLVLYFSEPLEIFLEIRKVIDMFNLLLLLFGTYSFMHVKTPAYWYRFSLYMLLLAVICMVYRFDLLSFYLPISIYQIIITIFICYNVFRKWNVAKGERIIAVLVFLTWGFGKSLLSIAEIFISLEYNLYITELMLSNIVNFCILTIYVVYTRSENDLVDSLYKTVVENSKDAFFYYKLQPYNAFQYVSPSIEDFTGFTPSSFYSNPQFYLHMVSDDQVEEITDIFNPKEAYSELHTIELCRKSGEKFWGEFSCTVLNDEHGEPIALEGTLRDVTKLKTAEMEQLEATRGRNMLLSYISHELRTPITSIAGYLTALSDGTMSSDKEKAEAMDIITSKTLTLKKLVDELDQLTKIETHQFTFNFESYTAVEATAMMISCSVSDARSAGFDVYIDYDANLLSDHWIIIDADRINQVFSNLVNNSIKYSMNTKKLWLDFEIDDNEENFVVSVKDSGIGIKDQHISHIFDRFYRADVKDNTLHTIEGRGLGLTLCKEIINAHQGEIFAESTYGTGSTFTFIIPIFKEG
ncbi:MAG: PAS domain S-box protein [Firmicutes bacterium]|nr:PAS domain S-box protein [Bacillota bacterium]